MEPEMSPRSAGYPRQRDEPHNQSFYKQQQQNINTKAKKKKSLLKDNRNSYKIKSFKTICL